MSQPDRTGFSDSMAITAGLAALALATVPSAVSHADKRTVTVEVAFVDRAEIESAPEPADTAVVSAGTAPAPSAADRETPAPVTRFNVITTPGRPLTVHVAPAARGDAALPADLLCSFGDRRSVACDPTGLTVTATAETEFRLDRGAAAGTEAGNTERPPTALEVTIAYQ